MKPEEYTLARLLNVLQSTQGIRMERLSGFNMEHPALQEWLSSRRRQVTNADLSDILGLSGGAISEIFNGHALPRDMSGFIEGVSGLCRLSPVEQVIFTQTIMRDLLRRKGMGDTFIDLEKGVSNALGRNVSSEEYGRMRRDFFANGVITTS